MSFVEHTYETAYIIYIYTVYMYMLYVYLDLPKGAKWLLKGVNSTSLRVLLAPLGRCWYQYDEHITVYRSNDTTPPTLQIHVLIWKTVENQIVQFPMIVPRCW